MKRVTLSFDNGPTLGITDRVLDILDRARLRATFFVIGEKLDDSKASVLMAQAHAAGHWIGNHTYTHTVPLGELDEARALEELERTEEALGWLEQTQRLFRPYGRVAKSGPPLLCHAVVERLQKDDMTCVLWNCVPGDWHVPSG